MITVRELTAVCACAGGLVHLAASGETSWHGFATAIVEGSQSPRRCACGQTDVAATEDYPTKVRRPRNSRLDLARLQAIFSITPPLWQNALSPELDRLAREFNA